MKSASRQILLALLVGSIAVGALYAADPARGDPRVTVVFEHPEKFTDVREGFGDNDNERGREHYLPLLKEYLEREAGRQLPAGQKLTVTFTDIDLAGDFEPWHGMQFDDIRILKEIYFPRLAFTFKVTDESGRVVKAGERKLVDMAYQMRIGGGFQSDSLRYEKGMLSDWMRDDIRARKN